MLRRLSTLAAAASFVLCAATCVLWLAANWAVHGLRWDGPASSAAIAASPKGAIAAYWTTDDARPERQGVHPYRVPRADLYDAALPPTYFGFGFRRMSAQGGVGTKVEIRAPMSAVATVAAILPAIWFHARSRVRRRQRLGRCPACGYDLRATPGRCPECGQGATDYARPV